MFCHLWSTNVAAQCEQNTGKYFIFASDGGFFEDIQKGLLPWELPEFLNIKYKDVKKGEEYKCEIIIFLEIDSACFV